MPVKKTTWVSLFAPAGVRVLTCPLGRPDVAWRWATASKPPEGARPVYGGNAYTLDEGHDWRWQARGLRYSASDRTHDEWLLLRYGPEEALPTCVTCQGDLPPGACFCPACGTPCA